MPACFQQASTCAGGTGGVREPAEQAVSAVTENTRAVVFLCRRKRRFNCFLACGRRGNDDRMIMRGVLVLVMWFLPAALFAEGALLAQARAPLFDTGLHQNAQTGGASLFTGAVGDSFFAPLPTRAVPLSQATGTAVQRLRSLIGQAESPRAGYDAVQHGARIKPAKPPSHMTLAEIFAWVEATPGQPHAIGRYQFIPETLTRVVQQVGARPRDRFTPALQDRLADVLLVDAGFPAFMAGQLSQDQFMNNLAAIWAGFPTTTGRSKYHGVAGNRATITLAQFRAEIAKIRPG